MRTKHAPSIHPGTPAHEELVELFAQLLRALGFDTLHEHLNGTPRRLARLYAELLRGYDELDFDFTTFEPTTRDMIISKDIRFHSLCSHHLVPFFGVCHIGYIPKKEEEGGKMAGLSKIARTVQHFAARLQVQETLTQEVANFLNDRLNPLGVVVVVEATHLCQEMRGVRTSSTMITSAVRGIFLEESTGLAKSEFFRLIGK